MSIRGIRKTGSLTVTSTMRGAFRSDPASRAELMSISYTREDWIADKRDFARRRSHADAEVVLHVLKTYSQRQRR